MQSCKSFGSRSGLIAVLVATLVSVLDRGDGRATPGTRGLLSIDIHDGDPYAPVWASSGSQALGNFMTWIDTWQEGFYVRRIWFYHGGDYAESGVPYEVHFLGRTQYGGGEEGLSYHGHFARTTTCNYCWEELDVSYWFGGGSDAQNTFGVFIVPLGGWISPEPRLWRDQFVDHVHLSALLEVWFPPAPQSEPGGGDRDLYSVNYYFSDYGLGEVLLGMEIESEGIVATEPTSFSAVKSLY